MDPGKRGLMPKSTWTTMGFLSACLLAAVLLAKGVTAVTEDEILRQISQIDPALRPVKNSTSSVQVLFSISIVHLVEMNEKRQALALGVWMRLEWVNELVQWDEQGTISSLAIPYSRLWIPDTYVQNSFRDTSDQLEVFMPQGRLVSVYPDGVTVYAPSLHLELSCPVDTTYFPFDTQQCLIHAGSWALSEDLVNISLADPSVIIGNGALGSERLSNSQWEIVSVQSKKESVVYENFKSSYSELKFILALQRRPLYHVMHLVLPIFLLHMLSLTTFLVPAGGGERMTVGLTTFLSFSVFSLVLTEQLPETSVSLPIISIYVITALVQNLFSILWSVYVVRAWSRPPVNSFHRAAVPVPAMFIRLVSLFTGGRQQQRMCSCINPRDDVIRGGQRKGPQTLENGQQEIAITSDAEAVGSMSRPYHQKQRPTRDICLWHSSLDNSDRMLFLTTLSVVILSIVGILIVLPYKQGYY